MTSTMLFNGQRVSQNATILANMDMELRKKHLIKHTTRNYNVARPDEEPRLVSHFLNTVGWRVGGLWLLNADRIPMTWDEIVESTPDVADALIAGAVAGGGDPGMPPEGTHFYGNNIAARRQAHLDSVADQKSLRGAYATLKEEKTVFFETLASHCTSIGKEVFRMHLPNDLDTGNTFAAWEAIKGKMGNGAGTNLAAILANTQAIRIIDDLPTYFAQLEANQRILADLEQPLNDAWYKSLITRQVKFWSSHESQPYQSTLDRNIHDPAMSLDDFKSSLLSKEQDLLAHWPRTASGRRPERLVGGKAKTRAFEAGQDAAYIASFNSEEDGIPQGSSARAVAFSGRCGLCKEVGHMTKECAQGWWCEACKWVHRVGSPCDKGTAKNEWKKAVDAKKGQLKLKAGGGGTNRG